MIRLATETELRALRADTEAAVRIKGLFAAYGADTPFLRLYRVGDSGFLSVMDGAAVLYLPQVTEEIVEETALFLAGQNEIKTVRSAASVIKRLVTYLPCGTVAEKPIMRLESETPASDIVTQPIPPRDLYAVTRAAFLENTPPFEGWYVDVSHRLRHGCCRISGVVADEVAVAGALTVAECDDGAVIGGVGTLPDHRRRGYAGACVAALTASLSAEHKTVWIVPKHEAAQRLYASLGFAVRDTGAVWKRGETVS